MCVVCVATLIVQELGFSGVEIGSHIRNGEGDDWNLDHPELQCVFAVSLYGMCTLPTHPVLYRLLKSWGLLYLSILGTWL